jgi:hypothetical protein
VRPLRCAICKLMAQKRMAAQRFLGGVDGTVQTGTLARGELPQKPRCYTVRYTVVYLCAV